jgi:hypothetical protein
VSGDGHVATITTASIERGEVVHELSVSSPSTPSSSGGSAPRNAALRFSQLEGWLRAAPPDSRGRHGVGGEATTTLTQGGAVGRKNWLVFGSQRGGEVACRLYSLVLSCKQCGADSEAYIEDVLMKVATTPASEIASLTPWAWQAARAER